MAKIDTREVICDELEKLALILNSAGLCEDVGPITSAIGFCRNYSDENTWRYQLNRLVFNLMYPPADTIPVDKGNLESLKVIFSINVHGYYLSDFNQIGNPFAKLCFDIELECKDSTAIPYISAWHLDKHIKQLGNPAPKFHHPEYHFAFGGNSMTGKADFGSLFLLASPRLGYPPMDAVLGIDFIIRNFYEKDLNQEIFSNTVYIDLVKKAQYRFWRAFSISFASRWFTFPDFSIKNDYTYNVIFPEIF